MKIQVAQYQNIKLSNDVELQVTVNFFLKQSRAWPTQSKLSVFGIGLSPFNRHLTVITEEVQTTHAQATPSGAILRVDGRTGLGSQDN